MTTLPSRYEGLEDKLPLSLDELHGPAEGVVPLPPRLAWSGLTEFDLADWRERLSLYRIIITGGWLPGDAREYLNADHLVSDWPMQRRFLGPQYREIWESRFPELRDRPVSTTPVRSELSR